MESILLTNLTNSIVSAIKSRTGEMLELIQFFRIEFYTTRRKWVICIATFLKKNSHLSLILFTIDSLDIKNRGMLIIDLKLSHCLHS